jgi:hypothetical protein
VSASEAKCSISGAESVVTETALKSFSNSHEASPKQA